MANLAISAVCNQHCPYCFTADHLEDKSGDAFLDPADFDARLDFLDRSSIDQVRLLGGEPTLHPQFAELVARARARGKKIIVFTNGLMPEEALACLEALPESTCSVMVNVNEPRDASRDTLVRQQATIGRLGQRAMLGFNIYRADFQPRFLLPLIAQGGCRPAVRLGLAQPCLSGENRYVYPHQYVAIGRRIAAFAREAAAAGVRVEFDCGFVRCMFSHEDMRTLEETGADVGWRCNPILDIDIAGNVIYCYPLSRLGSEPLTPEVDASMLRQALEARGRPYRQAGVFPECSTCPFKQSGECSGGCLAVTRRRFRHTPFQVTIEDQEVAQ